MIPSVPCLCVQQYVSNDTVPNVELAEYSDFVFLLSKLWEVDMDAIKLHWVINLFAAGLVDQGKQVNAASVFFSCGGVGGGWGGASKENKYVHPLQSTVLLWHIHCTLV